MKLSLNVIIIGTIKTLIMSTKNIVFEKTINIDKVEQKTLKIVHDDSCSNPRTEWSNLTKMVCHHRRYDLGDEHSYNKNDYSSWLELEECILKSEKPLVIKPLFLLDHSGISIRTTSFNDAWDSGQVGFVFINQEKIDELGTNLNDGESWPDYISRLEAYLEGEVLTYDDYLTGNVYGFLIEDADGDMIDSCWGFFGDNWKANGVEEHAGKEFFID